MNLHKALKKLEKRVNAKLETLLGTDDVNIHYINRSEDLRGREKAIPWHGELIIRLGNRKPALNFCWAVWSHSLLSAGVKIEPSDGSAVLHASTKLLATYLTVENLYPLFRKLNGDSVRGDRSLDFSLSLDMSNNPHLHWNAWADPNEWNSKDPWWKSFGVFPLEKIFGTLKVQESTTLEEKDVVIPMPEGAYPAHVKFEEFKFGYSRLPQFWSTGYRTHFDFGFPLPYGKHDSIYGQSMPAESIADGIGKIVGDLMREYSPKYPKAPVDQQKADWEARKQRQAAEKESTKPGTCLHCGGTREEHQVLLDDKERTTFGRMKDVDGKPQFEKCGEE